MWVAEAPICSFWEGWAEGGIPHEHTRDQSTWDSRNQRNDRIMQGGACALQSSGKRDSQVVAYRCGEGSQGKVGLRIPQSWLN